MGGRIHGCWNFKNLNLVVKPTPMHLNVIHCLNLSSFGEMDPRERLTLSRKLNDKAIGDGSNFTLVMSKSHKYNIRKNTRISVRLK